MFTQISDPASGYAIFASSWRTFTQRFGLFLLLALLPMLVVVVTIVPLLTVPNFVGYLDDPAVLVAMLIMYVAIIYFAVLLAALVQLKSVAMMTIGVHEITLGGRPDLRGLLARTKGFLPRMAGLITVASVIGLGAYLAVVALIVAFVLMEYQAYSGPNLMGIMGFVTVLAAILVPAWVFLSVRWLYTVQAVAMEGVTGFAGLGRSWTLTKGAFWRTFGYYLMPTVVIAAITFVVNILGQGLAPSDDVFAAITQMLLQIVVQLVALPVLQAYITFMYLDQRRRLEMPQASFGNAA